jgi:4-hydroxy-tetrahydrodipicolinate synthase
VESVGTNISTEITLKLIDRLPNFSGIVDQGMDWVYMIEVISLGKQKRPDFQLLPATDYMVSAGVIGGGGAFSALSSIAPRLVRRVYDLCGNEQYPDARQGQEDLAALHQLVKSPRLETGLKAAMRAMGRECGQPRPPSKPLGEVEQGRISEALAAMGFLKPEPRGW